MACASTLHVLIKKGVSYEITSHNMNCSTQTWRRWSYATAMDAVALITRAPWTKAPNTGVLLAVSPMKELMRKQANSLWRSVKQSIKGVKARQWQSQRARPFWRTICFILQEAMWVFSYSFTTQEQENYLVAFPSDVSLFLPMSHTGAPSF